MDTKRDAIQLVELYSRIRQVHLQIEGGGLDRHILTAGFRGWLSIAEHLPAGS